MVRFSFCGHELMALAQGALFWPARKALLVADLHLEKASWFARLGQMLPPYDTIATLADLTALSVSTDAREIWCLGDSFHDRFGCERLPARAREMLGALTNATRWTWITGNHDPVMVDHCGGEVVEEAEVDGLLLRHEADPAETRPELSGHFHPKLRISHRGRLVSRRCFVATDRKLILPAFGALTGGLDAAIPRSSAPSAPPRKPGCGSPPASSASGSLPRASAPPQLRELALQLAELRHVPHDD